jgi:hypothetical protein
VRFAAVPIDDAQRITRLWRQKLATLPLTRETAARPPPTSEALLAANLAGAAVNALDPQPWTHKE